MQEPEKDAKRLVKINEGSLDFRNNYVKTSRYNLLNFFPYSLLYQYNRYPNIYFLVICALTLIPDLSPFVPSSLIVPYIFILLLSMVRDVVEDFKRFKADKRKYPSVSSDKQ